MRKILFAMLGLVAIGMWALPAMALPTSGGVAVDGPAKVRPEPVPLENRAGPIGAIARGERFAGTMSGTMIRQTAVTSSWFMYPGACVQRALGTWSAKLNPVADSLQPTTGFPDSNFPNTFASVTTAFADVNSNLTFTSRQPGACANSTRIQYVNPGVPNSPLSVVISGEATCAPGVPQHADITVNLATNGVGAITTVAGDPNPGIPGDN